jgi:hypothetical protein
MMTLLLLYARTSLSLAQWRRLRGALHPWGARVTVVPKYLLQHLLQRVVPVDTTPRKIKGPWCVVEVPAQSFHEVRTLLPDLLKTMELPLLGALLITGSTPFSMHLASWDPTWRVSLWTHRDLQACVALTGKEEHALLALLQQPADGVHTTLRRAGDPRAVLCHTLESFMVSMGPLTRSESA